MKKITAGDTMHVYGALGTKTDYTVRTIVRLDEDIEPEILVSALKKTQQRYPYLCVRLCRDGERYFYEDNPLPVPLLHGSGRISLNSPETNYHVWAVCWAEDRIFLDVFHGITDGTGMYMLLSTLLYYYCGEKYGESGDAGIRTLEDSIGSAEYEDPQDCLQPPGKLMFAAPEYVPAFTFETDGGLTPSAPNIWDVEIPEDAFIRFTSANDSSPGTMVSLLLARAADSLYPDRTKDIISTYVINARPMLGAEPTHHNCLAMAVFDYEDRIKAMPFTTQCTVYRGKTFAQSYEDRVRESMALSAAGIRNAVDPAAGIEEKKALFGQMFNAGEGYVTYLVSYIGKWKYPALGRHIKELWSHPPNTFSLMVIIGAAGGKIFITMQQRFLENTVREAFLKQLEENGIPYKIRNVTETDIPYFRDAE